VPTRAQFIENRRQRVKVPPSGRSVGEDSGHGSLPPFCQWFQHLVQRELGLAAAETGLATQEHPSVHVADGDELSQASRPPSSADRRARERTPPHTSRGASSDPGRRCRPKPPSGPPRPASAAHGPRFARSARPAPARRCPRHREAPHALRAPALTLAPRPRQAARPGHRIAGSPSARSRGTARNHILLLHVQAFRCFCSPNFPHLLALLVTGVRAAAGGPRPYLTQRAFLTDPDYPNDLVEGG
jgi:hypothetical protein